MRERIRELVNATPFVDTHEHLPDESTRLNAESGAGVPMPLCHDVSLLFSHYVDSDLIVAGMPAEDVAVIKDPGVDPLDKWKRIAPYYERTRHTGYCRNVRETLRAVYGEDDIHEGNVVAISEKIEALMRPGYYRRLLRDVANIEYCQVNHLLDPVFNETEDPELLAQDISFMAMGLLDVDRVAERVGREADTLGEYRDVIAECFDRFGARAVAVKSQAAYVRRLNYEDVPLEQAAPLYDRMRSGDDSMGAEDWKALQDHVFHYCLRQAKEQGLPVKLHTGYYAGQNRMPLERVRQNAGDLCAVLQTHPDATFVLMHIGYPYEHEMIALAKQYANVVIDMCWAWIINPLASVRFVKEFLMAAPASKLLSFGGDYAMVEMVPGHAAIARQGLAQAMSELVEEGWLRDDEAPALIERLMRGNARALFNYDAKLPAWPAAAS
jgi:predicted TIM-barrel fold metal-dependent hydrolase